MLSIIREDLPIFKRTDSLCLLFAIAFCTFVDAEQQYTARVVQIPDGDTIQVIHNGRSEWIRLNGVDCPESGDPYTTVATQTAVQLFQGKILTIRPIKLDSHYRIVADVLLPNGSSPNRILILSGHCRWWHNYKRN